VTSSWFSFLNYHKGCRAHFLTETTPAPRNDRSSNFVL